MGYSLFANSEYSRELAAWKDYCPHFHLFVCQTIDSINAIPADAMADKISFCSHDATKRSCQRPGVSSQFLKHCMQTRPSYCGRNFASEVVAEGFADL